MSELRAYDLAKARIAAGEDELVPADVVTRLLSGESPLLVWRCYREFSQTQLAQVSGVNRVQIANIESGHRSGSAATLKKLATALRVALDDLV